MPDDDTPAPATTTTTATTESAPRSGEPDTREPSPERQAELRAAYDANVAAGKPPYEKVAIRTLGELEWILRERDWSGDLELPKGKQRPDLRGANLHEADLRGAVLTDANLSGAGLGLANLSGAILTSADLSGANLFRATLNGADLSYTKLSGSELFEAALRGADLFRAALRGADLTSARLDARTRLGEAGLDEKVGVYGVDWGGARLDETDWPRRLGDEQAIREAKGRKQRIAVYRDVSRAYRNLSVALRAQGLLDDASKYRLREQAMERKAKLNEFHIMGWIFSWLLNLVAGYGERPARSAVAYVLVLLGFAGLYYSLGTGIIGTGTHDAITSPLAALVFSVTSFHGRGFFPGGLALDDPITVLAAAEAVIGLFIEITFIATFTQRFFGGR